MDCYFYKMTRCSILERTSCEKCSFRKTERELQDGRRNAVERISGLLDCIRIKILKKYGGGFR